MISLSLSLVFRVQEITWHEKQQYTFSDYTNFRAWHERFSDFLRTCYATLTIKKHTHFELGAVTSKHTIKSKEYRVHISCLYSLKSLSCWSFIGFPSGYGPMITVDHNNRVSWNELWKASHSEPCNWRKTLQMNMDCLYSLNVSVCCAWLTVSVYLFEENEWDRIHILRFEI